MERLAELSLETTLVTNDKYFDQYLSWKNQSQQSCQILNDGTTTPEERLGAIGDLCLAIKKTSLDEDILLVGSDNFLGFSLQPLIDSFCAEPITHVCIWQNDDMDDQRRRGVVKIDQDSKVVSFQEKPKEPKSPFAAAPLYILPADALELVSTYLDEGGNPDSPGYLFEHLCNLLPMKAWQIPGHILDVGNPDSYQKALEYTQRA